MKYIFFFLTADFGKLNIKRLQTEHMHRYRKTFQLYWFKIQMNNSGAGGKRYFPWGNSLFCK